MASNLMLALLTEKLQVCCIEGTRVKESGLTVSTEVFAGEKVHFFHVDSNEGRKNLNMVEEGSKICDYLIYYTKDNANSEAVCFLELKGKHLDEAVKQILSTYLRVRELAREKFDNKQHQLIHWKVCIFLHGQAPRNRPGILDKLVRELGGRKENILIRHGVRQYTLLGSFLRENVT